MKKRYLILSTLAMCMTLMGCNENNALKTTINNSVFTAEGDFEKGSQLKVESLQQATQEQRNLIKEKDLCVDYNFLIYDIFVQKNNEKIQPKSKVKISLDFPSYSQSGHTVFHFKSDTEMEVLTTKYENKKLSFETTSFSIFIIGENIPDVYQYNVTFDLDGGSFAKGINIPTSYSNESDFPISLPIPNKEGYSFKGWGNAYDVIVSEITKKTRGDLLLKAKWEEKVEPIYTVSEDEKKVTFGSYPQNLIDDENLITSLNASIKNMPKKDDGKGWTSFGFYSKNIKSDYAWYQDIDFEGNRYRAVYFNSWRLRFTYLESVPGNWQGSTDGNQMSNGVELDKVYWFKFAPLQWRILTKDNQKALLMCDSAIDSMQYQHNVADGIPCDYAKSDIRAWLNSSFYDLAFGTKQKEIILTTLVDNSESSADAKEEKYKWNAGTGGTACESTEDKVFLLSSYELTNTNYGFIADPTSYRTKDPQKHIWWSEYGKYMGGEVINSAPYYPNCDWWTRSPNYLTSKSGNNMNVVMVTTDSQLKYINVSRVVQGVVPAIWINL